MVKKGPLAYVLKSAFAPLTSFVSVFLAWLDALMPLLLLAYFSIEPCCLNLSGGRKKKWLVVILCADGLSWHTLVLPKAGVRCHGVSEFIQIRCSSLKKHSSR